MWERYHLKRYRQGREMAEGAKVHAYSPEEAIATARALFDTPSCRNDTYEVVGTEPATRAGPLARERQR